MNLLQAGSLCCFIVLHDVSAAFDSSPRGYRGVQPSFAYRNRVPRAPARCAADLVPLAVAQSSMAWPPACGVALSAQEEEMSSVRARSCRAVSLGPGYPLANSSEMNRDLEEEKVKARNAYNSSPKKRFVFCQTNDWTVQQPRTKKPFVFRCGVASVATIPSPEFVSGSRLVSHRPKAQKVRPLERWFAHRSV